MYTVPSTPDLLKQTSVPFGLVLSPFAPVADQENEPAVSDFGPTGPVRCIRCKAYMCPYMQFIDGGRRFQCVFCKVNSNCHSKQKTYFLENGFFRPLPTYRKNIFNTWTTTDSVWTTINVPSSVSEHTKFWQQRTTAETPKNPTFPESFSPSTFPIPWSKTASSSSFVKT